MKSSISLFGTTFIIILLFASCSSPPDRIDTVEVNADEADLALVKADMEYMFDMENYKKETAERIATNTKCMVEFKRLKNDKMEAKTDNDIMILELEHKNSDMKKKMDDYKEDGKENWNVFKAKFTHDMDELGKEYKDLTAKKTI